MSPRSWSSSSIGRRCKRPTWSTSSPSARPTWRRAGRPDRLVAGGATGALRYLVREASVIETPLARKDGLEGVLKVEQSERYDARLLVEVELLDGFGTRQGRVEVEATRSNTIAENATLRERERLWFEMAEQLTGDMGQALEAKLREVMGLHLLR